MKTLFVVADVHGFFKEMYYALNEAGFDIRNDNHIFVSCGDLLDRGLEPKACLQFVNMLPEHRKKLIMGNHEELLIQAIYRGYFEPADIHNGTAKTVFDLTNIYGNDMAALQQMMFNEDWQEYIHSCINYYETDKYIFTHGYVPLTYNNNGELTYDPDWRSEFANWEGARWLNGMKKNHLGIKIPGKTIVCGHWHTSWGHCNLHNNGVEFAETDAGIQSIHTPFYEDGLIALDSCVVYSGFVNCLKIELEDE